MVILKIALVGAMLLSAPALADHLTVDKRSLQLGDTVTIIVSLEGDSAKVDNVNVPVRNLIIGDPPSVSSEFSWINGEVVRRKVFRFRARPLAPGQATAGPVTINLGRGRRQTLSAITLRILPDRASASNDPAQIARELSSTGRETFFVVAEADRINPYVGEEVVVTWTLYNAVRVQQWQIATVPKLESFWAEELDVRGAQSGHEVVDGVVMQIVPIRRVALFPLRAGELTVGSMEVEASVLRRLANSPFNIFEGSLVETTFRSAPITIQARPLPPGNPVDAVGNLTLRCSTPQQVGAGPVIIHATLSGRGNLRAAPPPRAVGPLNADMEVQPLSTNAQRTGDFFDMTRRWRMMLFPRADGELRVPALVTTVFDPSMAERRELRCEAMTLVASASRSTPAAATRARTATPPRRSILRRAARVGAPIALLAACALLFVPRWRRHRALGDQVRAVVGIGDPAAVRASIRQRLEDRDIDPDALMAERSDRGDAYRSLMSLLEAIEHERIVLADAEEEIARRVRELLVESHDGVPDSRDRAAPPPSV